MNTRHINNKFFQKLIERYLEGKTTADELKLLVNYYESFQKVNEWVEALAPETVIKDRILINILEAIKVEDSKQSKVVSLIKRNIIKYAVAASIILLISITFFLNKKNNLNETTPIIVNTNSIAPGTDKATLTLEDGTDITLEKGKSLQTQNANSNGEEIVYEASQSKTKAITYNYLTIPRGGQFFVKLSDGTQVWLNSESQLKYPISFIDGETRIVELVYGEAYFDVSPSIEHKGSRFKVFNQSQEIEVLGTEFNIKAYKGESNIFTTLVEGKVIINYSNKKQILKPNQQANLNIKSKTAHIVSVDVYNEISWKEGIFSFRRKSLSEIMKVLSRWYDTEFVIENSNIDKAGFNGIIGKDQKIEDILNTIKSFGVIKDYQIIDKIVIIK